MNRTALVTGASSGIGHATARALHARGYRVIGTSRNPDAIPEAARIVGVEYLALDLTDSASIEKCASDVGQVDVLVNNAGESQSGPLEDLPTDAIERLFASNVLGPVRLTQLLLPGMRDRGYGRVVMVGSMLASFPLAYRSSYVATKAAIKGFATAMRFETAPFGVWVTTVEPGVINTGIRERRSKYLAPESPYTNDFHTVLEALENNERAGIAADRVARTIIESVESDKPRSLYAVGSNAPHVYVFKRLAPRSVIETTVARRHGLNP
ncbi:SDR family oxidoreductase [Antrihabitans stalactiti]|uniref:SDR family oxidoreductase n=1 Tax=Antrihabitans stalactiti TaxID=2584121 RepID=A0A848KDM9_9NOCA|nr:SDR family oxidoreductase [Antrihabitans stalactiti]NMN95856.1 SDR family oxidoreductase [Antrihabitans stalactiti]